MSSNRFWVDWDDPPFPKIRPASEAWGLETELRSLTACKREIIEHARNTRQHWLTIINQTKALTESKIYRGEN